jgi:enamine deaminase RidA (YjgF/YER057c/UK114 family)
MTPHRLVGPAPGYSNAVVAGPGRTVHVAGQIGAGATLAEQFGAALRKVVAALAECDAEPAHVVTMTVYVTDVAAYRASLPDVGAAYRAAFGRHFPAMALVGVTDLVEPGAMVEIVATAVVP